MPDLAPLPRRHLRRRAALLAAALAAGSLLAGPLAPRADAATLEALIGQKLVVAMEGTTPSAALLGRIERGEVGGVILFGDNISSPAQVAAVARRLQEAAAAGHRPALLITTDQEGGSVRRIPWAPPTLSVPAMGATGSTATAAREGKATGRALGCAGVNVNLAPVADIPASTASFMYQQGRTWSFDATLTASLSDAFAVAHGEGGSAAVMKHFPGIGMATRNTDSAVVTITASASALAPGLQPYRTAIADGVPMIMLSNATYTAYDSANAAGWSPAISVGLLRDTLGFTGVSITDSLTGTAAARGVSPDSLAIRAATAGTDMILVTGSEASTASTYASLVAAAVAGRIPLAQLEASDARILALKGALPAPPADTAAPSVPPPLSVLAAGTTLGSATIPVRTSWSASDPCLVATTGVIRRVNAGAWTKIALPSYGTRAIVQAFAPGTAVRYGARATDNGGRTSSWAYGPTVEPFVRQQTALVAFRGTWATAASTAYSGGSTAWTRTRGASASYTFTGTSIGWVSGVGPTRGSAEVWVDGTRRAVVSTYASTAHLRRIVWAMHWPAQGRHTIRVVALGTAGHPRVDVDAFARLWQP